VFSHARRFFLLGIILMLAVIGTSACYFAFSGTNETVYEGQVGTPDSIDVASDVQDPTGPPVPEGLEDDFDLLDPDLEPPQPGDSGITTPPDSLP